MLVFVFLAFAFMPGFHNAVKFIVQGSKVSA
jgi:hypothetical protein